ncbi:MAG: hypothetical protein H6735_31185 [Alphaproteobacteria bacterium]|nr:hypothetical protein [Alphaproteobacteria bacterium]
MSRRAVVAGAVTALGVGAIGWWTTSRGPSGPMHGYGDCGPRLTPEHVKAGIDLCAAYMVAAQRPGGDFVYEVDWRTGKETVDSASTVRQAGTSWGMAEHAARTGDEVARRATDRALGYWLEVTQDVADGVIYRPPRTNRGALGTVVLVALALAERLKSPEGLEPAQVERMRTTLEGNLAFVRACRLPEGGFVEGHDPTTGERKGGPSPYADGEALLLWATLAVRDGRSDLLQEALAWAEQDHERNVRQALRADGDSATTKGYYQWGSMSWARLIEGGHDADRWGRRLLDLAVWMIDVHGTLYRTRNTAYAYEGLLSAYAEARRVGDDGLARRLACVSHQGLRKLCSWQLGHPLAEGDLATPHAKYRGGVQNHAVESTLRIDVTQHQLHALTFAEQTGVADHPL